MSFPNPDTLFRQLLPYFLSRNEFAQIAQTTLTGSVVSVTFSSIPQGFRNLLLYWQLRSDRVAAFDNTIVRFNADSGNNYDHVRASFNTGASYVVARATNGIFSVCESANARADNFGPGNFLIPGYSTTNREKFIFGMSSAFDDASADADIFVIVNSGRWRNTSAITSLTILPSLGTNFVSGSILQLYGMQ
jgi:hypothetical protein